VSLSAGAGYLCGAMDAANFTIISAAQRSALVSISRGLLHLPYYARYELLEFAVYTLATRVQRLVPLHAAAIGRGGRGLLLIGASGAGKSTAALHCLLQGAQFLSEDSVFVAPERMLATGIGSFVHLKRDGVRYLDPQLAQALRRSPTIRRRSGVEKLEVDVRRSGRTLAAQPLSIHGVVFLSKRHGGGRARLIPLAMRESRARMTVYQRFAAHHAGWDTFLRKLGDVEAFELRRGAHPHASAEALLNALGT
jgi:hypothetical protein